ncbi:ras-related and estrogen-regulated growth inhibitor [Anopheles ziemanni]|uniref:ras-related and estrogen-regulated growth inhibitor n=1 Tax=Anopheles coustani TaxID=139045 RepID=UPI0026595FD9|nr:ras-related and estrogen-regulated growth inhibitor [Anopheles coustani]XP_058167070.1 ras-related and estrogen-regulated growth inhibitor [Anopheles ziemanni]
MTTRGIRRKKSYLAEIKVAVIGAPCVGKSALTVRFLTKRYIGEYDHQAENRHKYEIMVDGEAVLCEIWDTCPKVRPSCMDSVQWADGLLLVYSITDRDSFNYIRRAKEELAGDTPVALVGNKVDMVHLRQVSTDEGEILAKDFECKFFEISAAEHVYQVAEAFLELCREVLTAKRKSKQSFIDKIDRMLSGSRTYNRGKSDSISPKD